MSIDRYTVLKWREKWHSIAGGLWTRLQHLYALCNTSMTTRLAALGGAVVVFLLVSGLVSLLRPKPPVPMSRQLVLRAKDAEGNTWALDYLKHQNIAALLNGPVQPGEPLTLTVRFARKGSSLLMWPELVGAAGEQYFPGILKNSRWQEAPRFVLTDSAGGVVGQGQFEYG